MAFFDKKGGITDIFLAMILSFVLVVVLVIFSYAQTTVHNSLLTLAPTLQESFAENVTTIINDTVGKTSTAFAAFRWISTLLIFGFFLAVLMSAFLVKTHPAWFIAYIMILIVCIITSVPLSNTYETLSQDGVLASTWYSFSMATVIFNYLPIWITVFGLLAGILMYVNLDWGNVYG